MTGHSEILVPVSTLLADAKTAIEDFLSTGKNLVGKALTIGDRLHVLKQGVPHGEFSAHEKALADCYGLTTRTLRNYRSAARAVAKGHSTREEAIALGLKGVLAAWRGEALPPPEPEPGEVEPVSITPKSKPKAANTIAALQAENDALKARLAALSQSMPVSGEPANDTEKPADALDDAMGGGVEHGPDVRDAQGAVVEPATGGAEIADEGGFAEQVGGSANIPPLNVCIPASVAAEILSLAVTLLPGGTKTAADYLQMAEDSPTNASKHRRTADIMRLNDLLRAAFGS